MKLVLNGRADHNYDTKSIELNGKPVKRDLGILRADNGEVFPITVWGDAKCANWESFADSGEPFAIVAELQAKPTTYTNHEGETVTVPNLQLKLYSYLNQPANKSVLPQRPPVDPTGSFVGFSPEQKTEFLKPVQYTISPPRNGFFAPLPVQQQSSASSAFPELDATPGLKEIL